MYFLRWIAGYPILIILLVIGLYALYNKDNLAHWFERNDASEQIVDSEHPAQVAANTGSAEASGQSEKVVASQPSLQIAEEEIAAGQAPSSVATADSEVAMNASEAMAPVPEVGEVQPMPNIDEIPPMPEIGEIPAMPDMGEVPPMPEMGEFPPMPEMGEMPPMPEMGEMPPMPEMGEMPPMPEMGEFPPMPEMGEIPPMEPFPEMPVDSALEPPMDAPVAAISITDEAAEKTAIADSPAGTEATTEIADSGEPEEKPGSWLDIFKGREQQGSDTTVETTEEVPVPEEMVQEVIVETGEPQTSTEIADVEKEKSGSWLGIFKGGKKGSDATVEVTEVEVTEEVPVLEHEAPDAEQVEVVVETGQAQISAEVVEVEKEKSGSWLDIFKAKKLESEEASIPAQQEQPVETEIDSSVSTETAETGKEEKSGSLLDIFKHKKVDEQVEKSADASGEYQQQHKESLRLARAAFWQRDYDAAEAIYVNMTKAEPENAALLGEYGNVLLQAGKMDQALDVYEQVADLLIAEGRTFELRPLLYFIGDQDAGRAQKITKKMQAQQQTEQ